MQDTIPLSTSHVVSAVFWGHVWVFQGQLHAHCEDRNPSLLSVAVGVRMVLPHKVYHSICQFRRETLLSAKKLLPTNRQRPFPRN